MFTKIRVCQDIPLEARAIAARVAIALVVDDGFVLIVILCVCNVSGREMREFHKGLVDVLPWVYSCTDFKMEEGDGSQFAEARLEVG